MLETISFSGPSRNSRSQFAGICFVKESVKEIEETILKVLGSNACADLEGRGVWNPPPP